MKTLKKLQNRYQLDEKLIVKITGGSLLGTITTNQGEDDLD